MNEEGLMGGEDMRFGQEKDAERGGVDEVCLDVWKGEWVGMVGEKG